MGLFFTGYTTVQYSPNHYELLLASVVFNFMCVLQYIAIVKN